MLTEKDLINRLKAQSLKVLIFDFDGTLLDINKPLKEAIEQVFKDYSINADIDQLVVTLKEKNFTAMRKWVAENLDGDPTSFYRKFFDEMDKILEPNSIPQLVIHMGRYQYQSAFVADQEINTVSFLTEVMADCQFK